MYNVNDELYIWCFHKLNRNKEAFFQFNYIIQGVDRKSVSKVLKVNCESFQFLIDSQFIETNFEKLFLFCSHWRLIKHPFYMLDILGFILTRLSSANMSVFLKKTLTHSLLPGHSKIRSLKNYYLSRRNYLSRIIMVIVHFEILVECVNYDIVESLFILVPIKRGKDILSYNKTK